MMQATPIFLLLGFILFSVMGQLFLKSGARQLAGVEQLEYLLAAMRNPHILLGLIAWVASTLCWLYVLKVAPLSRVYGLNSLNYVLIPLASAYIFGEQVGRLHTIGTILIISGVACLLSGE